MNAYPKWTDELQRQLKCADEMVMHPMSEQDKLDFKANYPWADLVVGDFEIRVINREKYGLNPQ